MAGAFRACLLYLLLFEVCIINIEAKSRGRSHSSGHSSHSSISHSRPSHTSHSYPSSHGLSGSRGTHHTSAYHPPKTSSSSGHGYPSSGGLSGSGNTHHTSVYHPPQSSYPGGLSGSGSSHHSSVNQPLQTSYPSSPSGHGYPSSGGLSGSGSRHHSSVDRPPQSSYPPPSGGHGYPSSGGLSGSGSRPTHSTGSYPSHNINTYPSPARPSYSGTSQNIHKYPTSHGSLSGTGSSRRGYHNSGSSHGSSNHYHHTSTVHHHHYHYRPPRVIYYGGHTVYPVYSGPLPTYVYEYRNSGSRYSNLLAGLALYNLGRNSGHSRYRQFHDNYRPQSYEVCKFRVVYPNGVTEDMVIDCRMITNFIYDYESQMQPSLTNTQTITTTNVTKTTVVQNQPPVENRQTYNPNLQAAPPRIGGNVNNNNTLIGNDSVLASGNNSDTISKVTLMPVNELNNNESFARTRNDTPISNSDISLINKTIVSSLVSDTTTLVNITAFNSSTLPAVVEINENNVTHIGKSLPVNASEVDPALARAKRQTITTNTVTTTSTQVSAMDPRYNGAPVDVSPEMKCYVIRTTPMSTMETPVSCGLIQEYSVQSLRNFSTKTVPSLTIFLFTIFVFVL